jgi:hypothetical protein
VGGCEDCGLNDCARELYVSGLVVDGYGLNDGSCELTVEARELDVGACDCGLNDCARELYVSGLTVDGWEFTVGGLE